MRWRHKKKALKKHAEGRPLTWREREYVKTVPNSDLLRFLHQLSEYMSRAAERMAELLQEVVATAAEAVRKVLANGVEMHQEWHYEKMRYAREGKQ